GAAFGGGRESPAGGGAPAPPLARGRGAGPPLPAQTRHNVTRQHAGSTDAQVAAVLAPLPQALRDRLVRANAQDLALYDRASALISRDHRP
ncbi:MAG TPA: hypothetical protein PKA35_07265, partial [Paracoccus solventivorans]|nr:hypothetical protein [Paracoccus solventivorans]